VERQPLCTSSPPTAGHRDPGRPAHPHPRMVDSRQPHLPIDIFLRSLAAESAAVSDWRISSRGPASDGTEGLRASRLRTASPRAGARLRKNSGGAPQRDRRRRRRLLPAPRPARPRARAPQPSPLRPGSGDKSAGSAGQGCSPRSSPSCGAAAGVDFTEYKAPSFHRRLARRMACAEWEPADYLSVLRAAERGPLLYEDSSFHVTSFFRPGSLRKLEGARLPRDREAQPDEAPSGCG